MFPCVLLYLFFLLFCKTVMLRCLKNFKNTPAEFPIWFLSVVSYARFFVELLPPRAESVKLLVMIEE
jgi:hypothetical protein